MSDLTILEVLESARINIDSADEMTGTKLFPLLTAMKQLDAAIELLRKGCDPYDDFNGLIDEFGSVEEVPENYSRR